MGDLGPFLLVVLRSIRGEVVEEASGLSQGSVEHAVDLGELSVVETPEVCCEVFGFEKLFYPECFEGGAKFSLGEGLCEFSHVISDQ